MEPYHWSQGSPFAEVTIRPLNGGRGRVVRRLDRAEFIGWYGQIMRGFCEDAQILPTEGSGGTGNAIFQYEWRILPIRKKGASS